MKTGTITRVHQLMVKSLMKRRRRMPEESEFHWYLDMLCTVDLPALRRLANGNTLPSSTRYDLFFQYLTTCTIPALKKVGLHNAFHSRWYDPDTTYEEDMQAALTALEATLSPAAEE